jgi:FtsZ-interacting cell division protein ZipA
MPELRWTLLILGVIFVAALAWYERRRPHQASRQTPHIGNTDTVRTHPGNAEPGWGNPVSPEATRIAAGGGRTEPGWGGSATDMDSSPGLPSRAEPRWETGSHALPASRADDPKTDPAWGDEPRMDPKTEPLRAGTAGGSLRLEALRLGSGTPPRPDGPTGGSGNASESSRVGTGTMKLEPLRMGMDGPMEAGFEGAGFRAPPMDGTGTMKLEPLRMDATGSGTGAFGAPRFGTDGPAARPDPLRPASAAKPDAPRPAGADIPRSEPSRPAVPAAPGPGLSRPATGAGAPKHDPLRPTTSVGSPKPDNSWGPDIAASNPRSVRDPNLSLPEIRVRGREPLPPRELPIVELPEDSPLMGGMRADDDEESDPVEDEFADEEIDADDPPIDEAALTPIVADPPRSEADRVAEYTAPIVSVAPPVLEWPPEDQRKLVSLRLVARPPDRFQGRLVRQALSAEGFILGPLDIFHKPDAQNRVAISAASLTKPGSFDLDTMDTQRYTGLNLFVVLPGPGDRSPHKAFEDLLLAARMLNERLEGGLQDERGGPLTPTRIQLIRDGLSEAKS